MIVIGVGKDSIPLLKKLDYQNIYFDNDEGQTAEEYESSFDERKFKKKVSKLSFSEILVIIDSSSLVSAISLRLLESIKQYKFNVLLLRSDLSTKSKEEKLMDRIIFGVLQQKARMTQIGSLLLIDVERLESMIGDDISINDYYDSLYNHIASTINWYYYIREKTPKIKEFHKKHEIANIVTLGLVDFETGEEKLFFNLKHPREKEYFYMLNKDELNKPGLLKKIKIQIKQNQQENLNIGYGIYESGLDESFVYCIAYSSYSWDGQEID
jgi:hypothetical protein